MKDWLTATMLSVLAIFAPIKALLLTTGIIIFADLILGIWAAHKRGESITSAGIRRTVTKLGVYNAAILLGFLIETYMLEGFIPISKIAGGLIGVVECKSIMENLNDLHGSDLFKTLIKKLGSINDEKEP